MADLYRVFGAGMSPSPVKICGYSRHNAVRHQWVLPGNAIWIQQPQKYHARSIAMPPAGYAAVPDKTALDPILKAVGCLAELRS
jgi:hypothetical protein